MFVFPVRPALVSSYLTKRVSDFHSFVYHGLTSYVERDALSVEVRSRKWKLPALTNDNREMAHVSRSGRFVPEVFGSTLGAIHVSEKVRDACAGIADIDFNPVVFEKLVDLSMPSVGDFSWDSTNNVLNKDGQYRKAEDELHTLPDQQQFHESIVPYYSLLAYRSRDLRSCVEMKEVSVDWGSYRRPSVAGTVMIPAKKANQYPVVSSGTTLIFREDLFERIAPFLDLDYFSIASIYIGSNRSITIEELKGTVPFLPPPSERM